MQGVRIARLGSLDSLRGVAAAIVVLHHCRQTLPTLDRSEVLHRLLPGSGAVLIFFVLSGLVLAMTFVYRDGDHYAPFVVKRVFRIWPAFAVAILASAWLRLAIGHHDVAGTGECQDSCRLNSIMIFPID